MKKVVKSAFFYGTLMHPKILREVLRKKGKHLQICTALLMDYTRHQVKNADYPGIVPYETGRKLIDRELEPEERCVRGTLVTGLTMADIKRLDWFETDDYIREVVSVYPLEELTALENFVHDEGQNKNIIERIGHVQPRAFDEILAGTMGAGVKAETYVYQDVGTLRPTLWSFSEFVEKNAWKWYGREDSEEEENEAPETEIDGRMACAALSFLPLYYVFITPNHAQLQYQDAPDLSRYRQLGVLSEQDFPFGDPSKRLIIVGDVHGQYDHLQTLLTRLSYNNESDKLFHVGDVVTKAPLQGSIDVLSFLSSNGIQGVRGNQDQKVIEWRSWINWVSSEPGATAFLESALKSWKKAEKKGEGLKKWNKRHRKLASRNSLGPNSRDEVLMDHVTAKWWRRVPSHLILFSDAYMVANEIPEKDYEYLVSLPVRAYVPHAHLFLVHAGLLSHDPEYDYDDPSQPLSKVLEASRIYAHDDRIGGLRRVLSPFTGWLAGLVLQSANNRGDHDYVRVYDKVEEMRRRRQERGILAISLNEDPWVSMNVRSVKDGKPTRSGKKGKPWSEIWNADMDSCHGFDDLYPTGIKNKHRTLPCLPMSVVYGHAAARGLDIKRWSFGLDTACAKGGRLTALVLGRQGDFSKEGEAFPFGDASEARTIGVNCKH
ncbi:hypothetical protein APHAL10511_007708 [Amanita phalloides]|nr:hypothetical protein APHAL10511_007708 [Amanita phalloides]